MNGLCTSPKGLNQSKDKSSIEFDKTPVDLFFGSCSCGNSILSFDKGFYWSQYCGNFDGNDHAAILFYGDV